MTDAEARYREVPYPSAPRYENQPEVLATIATLHGLEPAALGSARVLELACSDGGNLLAAACSHPGGRYLGIDISPEHIQRAEEARVALGLESVRFQAADIFDLTLEAGGYDYVIAHGVYSWVEPAVQDRILELCQRCLSPQGVACVSYKTFPGWHLSNLARGVMTFAARGEDAASERLKRGHELLQWVAGAVRPDMTPLYKVMLDDQVQGLGGKDPTYLIHEYLEKDSQPNYLHEFVADAARFGLQYLSDSRFHYSFPENFFPPQVVEHIRSLSSDQVELEQHLDLLMNRSFRWTLLTHADLSVDRSFAFERLERLHLSGCLRPVKDEQPVEIDPARDELVQFAGPAGCLETDSSPAKTALLELAKVYPSSLTWAELLERTGCSEPAAGEGLAGILLAGHRSNLLSLRTTPSPAVHTLGPRPLANPYARFNASRGGPVVNVDLDVVEVGELGQCIVPLLDGTRDLPGVLQAMARLAQEGKFVLRDGDGVAIPPQALPQVLGPGLGQFLGQLVLSGTLIG